jgi:hypothetical protein
MKSQKKGPDQFDKEDDIGTCVKFLRWERTWSLPGSKRRTMQLTTG